MTISQFVPHTDTMTPIPAGRIWWLRIYMGRHGKWCMEGGLSQGSLPACPDVGFIIKSGKERLDLDNPSSEAMVLRKLNGELSMKGCLLVPKE